MIFGTQIGFTGTMPQGQPMCPPDPVWHYFPSPFEPLTYFGPQGTMAPQLPAPPPPPICIEPPPRPGWDPVPEPATTLPPNIRTSPAPLPPVLMPAPSLPSPTIPGMRVDPRMGAFIPYGNEVRLSGLGAPGPFGMSWAGFLGVMGAAVAGGIGLGYLYHRR